MIHESTGGAGLGNFILATKFFSLRLIRTHPYIIAYLEQLQLVGRDVFDTPGSLATFREEHQGQVEHGPISDLESVAMQWVDPGSVAKVKKVFVAPIPQEAVSLEKFMVEFRKKQAAQAEKKIKRD